MKLEASEEKNPMNGIRKILDGINSVTPKSKSIDNFSLLDFYYICSKYGISKDEIKEMYYRGEISLKDYQNIYNFINRRNTTLELTLKDSILAVKIQYGNREITQEEKLAIWDKLEKDGIPIDSAIFSTAVYRYFTGRFVVNIGTARK